MSTVEALYWAWLDAWNRRDAHGMAELLADGAEVIGFDGSRMTGAPEVERTLAGIFAHHPTGRYVAAVRAAAAVAPGVALLRAECGMVPAGAQDVKPELHAVQTLLAVERAGAWRIRLFQNTPAQWHGRPQDVQALTEELRQRL